MKVATCYMDIKKGTCDVRRARTPADARAAAAAAKAASIQLRLRENERQALKNIVGLRMNTLDGSCMSGDRWTIFSSFLSSAFFLPV